MLLTKDQVFRLVVTLGLCYVVRTNALICMSFDIVPQECEGICYTLYKITEENAIFVNRGCSIDKGETCEEDSHFCLFCNTPLCLFPNVLTLTECTECNSDEGQCTMNPTSIESTVTDYACFASSSPTGANTRGGVRSRSEICVSPLCNVCTRENLCNNIVMPEGRKQCSRLPSGETEICLNMEDTCRGVYSPTGNLISSGCYEQFEPEVCTSSTCMECPESTCPLQVLTCLTCDESNPDCTIAPDIASSTLCLNGEDSCLTRTEPVSSRNSRECGLSEQCGEGCKYCTKHNCNALITPSRRTGCFDTNGSRRYCLNVDDSCTGVYTNEGLLTNAGCSEEVQTSCTDGDTVCVTCGEINRCADELLNCLKCTADDKDCTINPTAITTRDLCLEGIGYCAVQLTDEGENSRGCLKSLAECEEGRCSKCPESGCNDFIFPEIRTMCYSKEEIKRYCLNPVDQCTGLYSEEGVLLEAGCSSEFTSECIGPHCMLCEDGPCASKLDLLSCVSCESSNEACTTNPESISSVNCKLFETCFVKLEDNNKNSRGCLQENELCEGDSCIECNEDLCNTVPLPASRRQCVRNNEISSCLDPNDVCVGIYDETGELIKTGCQAELDVACSGPMCVQCPEDGCIQTLEPISCIVCDEDDVLCTTNPLGRPTKECDRFEECYVTVNDNGRNIRGCLTDGKCTDSNCYVCNSNKCNANAFPENRRQCTNFNEEKLTCLSPEDVCKGVYDNEGKLLGAGCQKEFNEDVCNSEFCRDCEDSGCSRQLHVCTKCDVTDLDCTVNPSSATSVLCNSGEEICFVNENDGLNARGCISKGHEETCGTNCHTCEEHLCNNIPYPEDRRQCYTCSGGKDCDRELKDDKDQSIISICKNINDDCFTKVREGSSTIRGCVSEEEDIIANCSDDNCAICNETACNSQFGIREASLSCYVCNSTNTGCGFTLSTDSIEPRTCKGKVTMGQTEQCFSFIENVIERGCVLELNLSEEEYLACANNSTCTLCNTDNCNTQDINTASSMNTAIFLIFTTIFITLMF